jgi:septal ring factor EnvC (AmiA/AmiB activator)
MYGDTVVMRKRAGQLREQGADIRATADQLVARSEAIPWRGRAAEAMRARVKERAHHLRAAAHAHDTAADSLERHLAEVDRLKESIGETERRLTGDLAEARARVEAGARDSSAAGSVTDRDRILAAVEPPPAGHADWLSLELPAS